MSIARGHVTVRGVDVLGRAEMPRVVEERREQVVRRRDGVDVAGEVQVDVVGWPGDAPPRCHRLSRRTPARAWARAEPGPHFSEPTHSHRQGDRRRGLSFSGGCRVYRAHQDEPPRAPRCTRKRGELDLRFATAIRRENVFRGKTETASDLGDWGGRSFLSPA